MSRKGKNYYTHPIPQEKLYNIIIPLNDVSRGRFPLTKILQTSFDSCSSTYTGESNNINSITIPYTVEYIETGAFSHLQNLTSFIFDVTEVTPSKLSMIGDFAFANCTKLTSFTIPPSVVSIGKQAFFECNSLTGTITIPPHLTEIKYGTFARTDVKDILIPDSLTELEIEKCAFAECKGLLSIYISKRVKSIGQNAFAGCTGLTEITFDKDIKSTDIVIDRDAFAGCIHLQIADADETIKNTYFRERPPPVTSILYDYIPSIRNKKTMDLGPSMIEVTI